MCEEAVKTNLSLLEAFHTPDFEQEGRGSGLLESLQKAGIDVHPVPDGLFSTISDTKNSQGIILLAKRPDSGVQNLECALRDASPLTVILHQINNPANLGAVMRAAEAAMTTGVITTKPSTDPFSPKALRGSMGSAFRVPVWHNAELREAIDFCHTQGSEVACATLDADQSYTETDLTRPMGIVFGSEARGLTEAEARLCDRRLKIPMAAGVESLNIAVAAGVILFEAKRQRDKA